MVALTISFAFLNGGDAEHVPIVPRIRTSVQFKQAFTDGFWRGLSGKDALVVYYPIRYGSAFGYNGYTYYQPVAKYYAPGHGYVSEYSNAGYAAPPPATNYGHVNNYG